jgi:hypothetical protein
MSPFQEGRAALLLPYHDMVNENPCALVDNQHLRDELAFFLGEFLFPDDGYRCGPSEKSNKLPFPVLEGFLVTFRHCPTANQLKAQVG